MIETRELLIQPENEQHKQYEQQTQTLRRRSVRTKLFSRDFIFSSKFILCLFGCLLVETFMTMRYGNILLLGKESNVYIIEELILNQNLNIINAKEDNKRIDEDNIPKYDTPSPKIQKKKEQNKEREQQQGIKQRQKLRSSSRKEQEKVSIEKNTATTTIISTANHELNYSAKAIAASISSSISKHATKLKEEEEGETFWTLKDEEDYAESLKPWANLTTRSFSGDYFFFWIPESNDGIFSIHN